MSQTMGDLMDRLSIVNIKLYMVQDTVHHAAAAGEGLDPETVQKLTHLNLERSRLMTEVDECLRDAVATGSSRVDPRIKIVD